MLYLVLLYLLTTTVCLIWGILFYELMANVAVKRNIAVYLITGLIAITGIAQIAALFTALNLSFILLLLLATALLAIIFRKNLKPQIATLYTSFSSQKLLFFVYSLPLILTVLVINSGPTIMDDTDSYHIQMIKWLHEYGTVRGIANLHLRYGFNSSWFIAISALSPASDHINTYMMLNGLLSVWMGLYLLEKISKTINSANTNKSLHTITALVLYIVCLTCWPLLRGSAANTNYDFIATCCIIILFTETLSAKDYRLSIEWLLWPAFLFTIRIINFPLMLAGVPVIWHLLKQKQFKYVTAYCCMVLFLIVPFITRNVLLSGYAFFPVYQFDVFSVDWKVNKQLAHNIVEFIKYFNRVSLEYMPLEETRKLSFPEWIFTWFRFRSTSEKTLIAIALLSYPAFILKKLFRRDTLNKHVNWISIVLCIQLICWLLLAPDPRFAFGPLLCSIILLLSLFPASFSYTFFTKLTQGAMLAIPVCLMFYTTHKMITHANYRNYIAPLSLPVPKTQIITIDGIPCNIPDKLPNNWNARCYGTMLPCFYRIMPGLRARGKDIKAGFRQEETTQTPDDPYFWP